MGLIQEYSFTSNGPRSRNEDSYTSIFINGMQLFCVADGVGGNKCGDVASKYAVDALIEAIQKVSFDDLDLKGILLTIHTHLLHEGSKNFECRGMATTFTAAVIKDNILKFVHTGDSRIYVLRANGLKQITNDHTEVARLIKEGLLSLEDSFVYPRKNIIDSALGIDGNPLIQMGTFSCLPKDRILISTDGFYNVFSKKELRDISLKCETFNRFSSWITEKMVEKKLTDNATFVVVEI